MNIKSAKGLIWVASLAVSGYLGFYVYEFYRARDVLAEPVAGERILAVLDAVKKPEEQKTDVVAYGSIQRVFHELDWTGKPPPKVAVPKGPEDVKKPRVPMSSVVRVMALSVNTSEREKSLAVIKFLDTKMTTGPQTREDSLLRPDERLPAPHQYARVAEITPDGVVFAFDDEAREKETVAPPEYQSQRNLSIVVVGPGGAILPQKPSLVTRVENPAAFRPGETVLIRKNEYQVGTKTLERLDEDYSRILSRDVRYSAYRNPRTGSTEGIKVNYVAPGSLPAQHGLQEGEILKSINGHAVTSVNDAIAYVKANANTTDTWVAVFENQGREFTRTYHSPGR